MNSIGHDFIKFMYSLTNHLVLIEQYIFTTVPAA